MKSEYVFPTVLIALDVYFAELSDRIRAAAKRERAFHAMTEEANERLREHLAIALKGGVGNAAKLREALVLALSLLDLKEGVPYKTVSQKDIDFMKAALAEKQELNANSKNKGE